MGKLLLDNVMQCFVSIAEPKAFSTGNPAYQMKIPIVPGSQHQRDIEAEMLKVAQEKWGDEKGKAILAMLVENDKVCFVKKVYRAQATGEPHAGFAGMHYLSCRHEKNQPSVFDQYKVKVENKAEIERKAFSGAIVHASVEIWAQDNQYGKRINCSPLGVMLTGEGTNFGGGAGPATEDDFAAMAKARADASDLL